MLFARLRPGRLRPWLARIPLLALLMAVAVLGQTAAPVAAAAPDAPSLTAPEDESTLTSFQPILRWTNPASVTQVHMQVIPFNNDGPGVNLHIGSAIAGFAVPPPPRWYGLLPDMTYTWRVRVSNAAAFVDLDDPSWSEWSERQFRTPKVDSSTLTALTPVSQEVVTTRTPTIMWENARTDVFYYELQLSKDVTFNTDPATATASVTWLLLHGGVTRPVDSYTVATANQLEDKATYYWRVRPRVQGDGTPVEWSAAKSLRVDTTATATLTAGVPLIGSGPGTGCAPQGPATTFASTASLTSLYLNYSYTGSGRIAQVWYRDNVPIDTTGVDLAATSQCRAERAVLSPLLPATPGAYTLELWQAGQRIRTAGFTITPATSVGIGPITFAAAASPQSTCQYTGTGDVFTAGSPFLLFRWNTVGTGTYTVSVFHNGTQVASGGLPATGPIGCNQGGIPDVEAGTWRVDISVNGQVVQSATATVQ